VTDSHTECVSVYAHYDDTKFKTSPFNVWYVIGTIMEISKTTGQVMLTSLLGGGEN
jgi:hypothetical protein